MQNSMLETPELDESGVQPSTFRFRHPKAKKYMLHRMISVEQKQALNKLKRKTKKKDPEYFSKMLQEQRKKMFVNTFVKKLKNSIILLKPPPQCKSSSEQVENQDWQSFQVPKDIELCVSLFFFLQVIPLLILNSLSMIFTEIEHGEILVSYNIFSFIVHILQVAMKLLIKHNYQEKKKKFLKQNIHSYLCSQDLIIDIFVLLGFVGNFIFKHSDNQHWMYAFHVMILLKIKTLLVMLGHIELVLIENEYRQEIWNLIKVFLVNFIIAHFLTIILISMAGLNTDKNWIQTKGLTDSQWDQKYVWGYYWSINIMLTVGFGDIVPTNQDEALCLIFVQTVSCIVLAYNINRVGSIISKIRSYDLEKNNNLKVFNQISQKAEIDPQIQDKLTNYIKQSTIIKRNSNIEQEKNFIAKLPLSFKEELLKQMNKNIWNGMIFFRNLSEKSLLELSKHLEKKLTHPEQIVYTRGGQVDLMIFNNGTFGLAYNNGSTKSNGNIIQQYHVNANEFRIVSLDFLLDKPMNYDIKCIDYTIFYKVSLKSFLQILQNHPYDYEYYFMIKEKDKFLLNQFEIEKCHICQNQRHTMFKCPRLHYIPLKQHVINKYTKCLKTRHLQNSRSKILKRQKISDIDSLKQMKNTKNDMLKIRLQICANKSESDQSVNEQSYRIISGSIHQFGDNLFDTLTDPLQTGNQQQTYLNMAMDQIRQNLVYKHHEYSKQKPSYVWEVECDLAHNYKFYFKNFNSEDLGKKIIKKKPKPSLC